MDHKMQVLNVCNWIAMKDPNPASVAAELAVVAGLVAHQSAVDECEREHAEEALIEQLRTALRTGKR